MSDTFRRCTKVEFVEANAPQPPATSTIQPLVTNAAFASVEKKALLVGGYLPGAGTSTDQVLEYDFLTKQWSNLTSSIPLPPSGNSEAAAANPQGVHSEGVMVGNAGNNTYYLFGGYNDQTVVGDMYKLSVPAGESAAKGSWTMLNGEGGPSARRGHSMVLYTPISPQSTPTPDLATSNAPVGKDAKGGKDAGKAGDAAPAATTFTNADGTPVLTGAKIFLFGGFDGQTRLNDLWVFDCDTESWSSLDAQGVLPAPRDGAALVADPFRKELVLFAGYTSCRTSDIFVFNLDTGAWNQCAVDQGPTPRMGCFGAFNGTHSIFGFGQDAKGASSLVAQIGNITDEKRWTLPTIEGDEIADGLIQFSWCLSDGGKRVLIYGGTNEKKTFSTLLELEIEKMEAAAPVKGKK